MNILWLINIPLPEASLLMKEKPIPFGGWLITTSKELSSHEDIKLSIAFPSKNANKFKKLEAEKINYYPFAPINKFNKKIIEDNESFKILLKSVKPDIVHIYGTEMLHTLSMVNVCNKLNIKSVISIQGLVSIIEKHMYSNLPIHVIYGKTFRNFIRRDNVNGLKRIYKQRGKNEIKAVEKTNHIIGRTIWDKACSHQMNPGATYHFCNETLREVFYKNKWDINNCDKYSIFLSQGQYPIKGLHFMLDALPIILKSFPNSKVYISGKNIIKSDTVKDKLLITYYGKYIKKKIIKLGLEKKVIFTGPLDEVQMCQKFLKSHVFVSPSTIENESNSLSEAKIMGVPSIASYVGGVTDRIQHNVDGFHYQHDAPYMLAHYICEIFGNDNLAIMFSEKSREHALKIHDREENAKKLISIYKEIINLEYKEGDKVEEKYLFISNMAAPYQVKFCYALQEHFDAEFWFYEHLDETRPEWWKIPLGDKCKVLKASGKLPKVGYFSLGLFIDLIKFKPDIVLLGGFMKWHVLVLYFAKLLNAKVAVMSEPLRYTSNDDQGTTELMTKENSYRKIKLMKKLFSKADLYIGMEEFAKHQFIDEFEFPAKKVISLSYPQDIEEYYNHPLRQKKYGDSITLLFANRLVERYQPLIGLEVFRRLALKYPHVKMLMNAEGAQKKECVDFVNKNNLTNVKFLDKIDSWNNMHLIYKHCDILILPGVYSNGNGTIIEARASGMGIVVSNQINNIEKHSRNDENCFICNLNVDEFEKAVSKYIDNPELLLDHGKLSRKLVMHLRNDYTANKYYSTFKEYGFIE